MANFQRHGTNVDKKTVKVPAGGKLFELGLWGPVDTRTDPPAELMVSLNPPVDGVTPVRAGMVKGKPIRIWQFKGLPAGTFRVEAKESGGTVWTSVTIEVA